jgi:hypothetical protein
VFDIFVLWVGFSGVFGMSGYLCVDFWGFEKFNSLSLGSLGFPLFIYVLLVRVLLSTSNLIDKALSSFTQQYT